MLCGGRLAPGSRRALAITTVVTWTSATLADLLFCPDPSDIGATILLFLFFLPGITVPIAVLVATRLLHRRREVVAASIVAGLGWIAGLVIVYIAPYGATSLWMRALEVAPPAIYIASGAIIGAGFGRTATE